ncbi:hypothetical protein AB6A40_006829 [Gnathostoma spinigerum]|uniref:Uncharacterized protein n=1 Tax=Gnathostoma spinigerum TaxID=75299 RepID=A0ABD6EJH2_9BILA
MWCVRDHLPMDGCIDKSVAVNVKKSFAAMSYFSSVITLQHAYWILIFYLYGKSKLVSPRSTAGSSVQKIIDRGEC